MSRSSLAAARAAFLALVVTAGCQAAPGAAPEPPRFALRSSALTSGNGIASNGIASNGIASNGIASNGIASNGIASNGIASNGIASNGMLTNGLSPGTGTNGLYDHGLVESSFATTEFHDWFAKDASYSDMVMTYVARCALAEGEVLSYTTDAASYSWAGTFGLAPTWASGQPIPVAEQELVSACLAAHTNAFGRHVSISVRGFQADGQPVATTADELETYRFREGCFFGNLFTGPGTFMGLEADSFEHDVTTPRGCVAENGVPTPCSPMVHAGTCAEICQRTADGAKWGSCTANGVAYRPLRVFLSAESVYRCGDGVCQFTESADSCAADCAP